MSSSEFLKCAFAIASLVVASGSAVSAADLEAVLKRMKEGEP